MKWLGVSPAMHTIVNEHQVRRLTQHRPPHVLIRNPLLRGGAGAPCHTPNARDENGATRAIVFANLIGASCQARQCDVRVTERDKAVPNLVTTNVCAGGALRVFP
jgi:hypothetical protein